MNGFKKRVFLLALIVFFTVFSLRAAFGEEIKIGVIGPMKFVPGQSYWNGAGIGVSRINYAKGDNNEKRL